MNKELEYQNLNTVATGKIHISFSEFSKYQQCGYKHLIEKYLGLVVEPPSIHLIFGNSVHKAIEIGIKTKIDVEKRVNCFREDFYMEMMNKMRDNEDFNKMNSFLDEGENIIRYLSTEKILKKYKVIGVEYPLYEKIFGIFYFKGFIDLIVQDIETGNYVIIDWKTSGEEWDVSKKKKDSVFMCQMKLYKYFFSRKENVPLDKIQCKYVVLNRLKNKKYPEMGYGQLQTVEIYSNPEEIEEALYKVAETIKRIHIDNDFQKAKLIDLKKNCFFCPHKTNFGLCNNSTTQHKEILKESREILN